ncbi:MAG: XisI protein [Cyanobacteria bacterium RI_101]|nr:XisI protein [Cyanobacteria bacterium RI_101]
MDTLTQYRQYIQQILSRHAQQVWDQRIQAQMIIDPERDHYQLLYVGWRDSKRVFGVVIHVDIIDHKIWIQQDGTEIGVANELLELGVPKTDIVLAFDPPHLRKYTTFAIA